MSRDLVHVGFGSFIELDKVVAIVTPGSAPIQRLIRDRKRVNAVSDRTGEPRRRAKAVVVTDDQSLVLVAITPEALAGRGTAARAGRVAQAQAD